MDPANDQKSKDSSTLNSEPQAVVVRREPEKDLLVWTAPSRPFMRRDKQFYTALFAIAGIVSLILFFAEGLMPVILIVALVFLYYVLYTVPPENIEYKITTKGIRVAGSLTAWQDVALFWFSKKAGSDILIFETLLIPGRMELVITPEIKDGLKKEISAYVPYEDMPSG